VPVDRDVGEVGEVGEIEVAAFAESGGCPWGCGSGLRSGGVEWGDVRPRWPRPPRNSGRSRPTAIGWARASPTRRRPCSHGWPLIITDLPSPEEVEAARTPAGGWKRVQLAAWGVPWPPPKGWKGELAERWQASRPAGPPAPPADFAQDTLDFG
jgi:hypothetical protein